MQFSLAGQKISSHFAFAIASVSTSFAMASCPDLTNFYEFIEETPAPVIEQLSLLQQQCSQSAEYFALLGAAHLYSGDLLRALEELELSLLLDPENGAAAVDYAEVLYRQGQILSALEVNQRLLSRADLPEALRESLRSRQRRWGRSRILRNFSIAVFAGFDDNLNSAPISDQLSLTLSGSSVTLDVSPDFQAKSGAYSRVLLGGAARRLGQAFNTQVSGQVRGRFSGDSRYELVQASSQASFSEAKDSTNFDGSVGLDHVLFGGNAIFSSVTARTRYVLGRYRSCRFYPRLAIQYQYFHEQSSLSGIETGYGAGGECNLFGGNQANQFAIEMTAVTNRSTEGYRLGEDRDGWRLNLLWRGQVGDGELLSQYVRTRLADEVGYSPLFKSNAKREEILDSVFLQYRRPLRRLGASAQFFTTYSYHSQDSTIDLFKTRGNSFEIGINWSFY